MVFGGRERDRTFSQLDILLSKCAIKRRYEAGGKRDRCDRQTHVPVSGYPRYLIGRHRGFDSVIYSTLAGGFTSLQPRFSLTHAFFSFSFSFPFFFLSFRSAVSSDLSSESLYPEEPCPIKGRFVISSIAARGIAAH